MSGPSAELRAVGTRAVKQHCVVWSFRELEQIERYERAYPEAWFGVLCWALQDSFWHTVGGL